MNKTKKWTRNITNPVIVVLVISLVLVIFNLYLAQRSRPYSSDDVSWQNILRTWTPTNGHVVYLGSKDNFLVNVPLLAVLGHMFTASRTLLFVEASIFAVINFVLIYAAGLYFLKKCQIKTSYETLLPFIWLASFGFNFSQLFLNTSWRDFEMGVSFIYFVLATKLYYGELEPFKSWASRAFTGLAILVAGAFIYSDPYFLYMTVAPIASLFLALFVFKWAPKWQALLVVGSAVLSMVVSIILKLGATKFGLFSPQGVSTLIFPVRHLLHAVTTTIDEMTTIFGVSISGVRMLTLSGVASILNLTIILAVALWFVWLVIVRYRKRQPFTQSQQLSPLVFLSSFFGALFVLAFIANLTNDEASYRYFVISAYIIAILAMFVSNALKRRTGLAFTLLIWATILTNLATALFSVTPMQAYIDSGNKANSDNYALIQTVKKLGLTRGYGNYWDGNINTYLSGSTVNFLPVTCISNETKPLQLLVDTTLFAPTKGKSFYLLDPAKTSPVMCSEKEVVEQFGKPYKVVASQNMSILIYNYDLATKM